MAMLDELLELAAKDSDQAEVYQVRSTDTPVSFEANRLKQLQSRQTSGVALRLIRNGRLGFTSSTRPEPAADIVARALSVAEFGAEVKFDFPATPALAAPQVFDPAVEALTVEAMVARGQQLVDTVRAADSRILCDVRLGRAMGEMKLRNSAGGQAHERKSVYSASLSLNLTEGEDILDIFESEASCRAELDFAALSERILRQLAWAKDKGRLSTAAMPVIFVPKAAAGAILSPIVTGLNGKLVQQGASPLRDRLGEQLLPANLSFSDDPWLDYATGSCAYDDEGVPTRRKALIENGVLREFLFDLQTAGLMGRASTGNGFRSLEGLPGPSPTNLVLSGGAMTLEEMIADVQEGLIVYQTMGAWAGNLLAGDFSANVHLGYRIENGRLAGRVKDTMVAGNVYQAMASQLVAAGSEPQLLGGSALVPPLYFREMSVSAKQ